MKTHRENQSPLTRRHFLTRSGGALAASGAFALPNLFIPHAGAVDTGSPLSPANDKIQKSREVALAILKPSAKDLEHGFRLHEDALVFESYGFCPA
ncbi:MAG: twin-arginine translocation signal domain-containing protein, partial [Prosthecobacter sp.]|nr:twin-arginine translocation signal domain-containing protein [Prosthecobacter sp.]